jgi:hypothetical protein
MAATLRKLSKPEWDDVRGLATTVTGYDPAVSPIKGKTTVQILNQIKVDLAGNAILEAEQTIDTLIKREAFNAFVGMEGKKRRRN